MPGNAEEIKGKVKHQKMAEDPQVLRILRSHQVRNFCVQREGERETLLIRVFKADELDAINSMAVMKKVVS